MMLTWSGWFQISGASLRLLQESRIIIFTTTFLLCSKSAVALWPAGCSQLSGVAQASVQTTWFNHLRLSMWISSQKQRHTNGIFHSSWMAPTWTDSSNSSTIGVFASHVLTEVKTLFHPTILQQKLNSSFTTKYYYTVYCSIRLSLYLFITLVIWRHLNIRLTIDYVSEIWNEWEAFQLLWAEVGQASELCSSIILT